VSESYGTTYRDEARPAAISTATLLGRDVEWAPRGSSGSPVSACCSRPRSRERFRAGSFAMGWLFATALVIGLGLGPVISYFATVETGALTWLATGIFVSIIYIFVSLLNIFSGD
jgi:hypothetical protein